MIISIFQGIFQVVIVIVWYYLLDDDKFFIFKHLDMLRFISLKKIDGVTMLTVHIRYVTLEESLIKNFSSWFSEETRSICFCSVLQDRQ